VGKGPQVAFEVENLDGNDLGLLITDGVMLAIMIASHHPVDRLPQARAFGWAESDVLRDGTCPLAIPASQRVVRSTHQAL
jgi:hypothetical protein